MIKPLTHEEAKKKICPFAKAGMLATLPHDFDPDYQCNGDDCMAWSSRKDGKGWCGMLPAPRDVGMNCFDCNHYPGEDVSLINKPCATCDKWSKWEATP